MRLSIDLPVEGEVCERMSIRARGWVLPPDTRVGQFTGLTLRYNGRTVARCAPLLLRADVAAVHSVSPGIRSGFDLLFDLAQERPGATGTLEFFAERPGEEPISIGSRAIRLSSNTYTSGLFPALLDPSSTDLLHRCHIYNSGPSSPEPSPECLGLILERLDPSHSKRLIDVGCGIGAYARPLEAAGFSWTGVEVSAAFCAALAHAGLTHRLGDGRQIPFPDSSFDAAVCIEVLEHIEDAESFVHEIQRVAGEAIFSVPNCELIPYHSRHLAAPWHVMEPDHKNFFSRWTLRALLLRHFKSVDVIAYGPSPLRSVDGAQLYYHLLAHARR